MPDYGVDTHDWEGLPWSWAAECLTGTRNYWLVTVSAAGRPHSMPVWGLWHDESSRFAFSCAPGSRKARNLRDDGRAVVTGDDTVEVVSIEGRCYRVEDDAMREVWIERYLTKYQPMSAELNSAFLRANLFWEFVPERGFGIIERAEEFAQRATRWTFDG
jgi:general stress protein 26